MLVESTAKIAQSNAKVIDAAASARVVLRNSIDELARVAGQVLGHMQEMQAEIKGLQLENRRLLDLLLSQNSDRDSD